MQCREIIPGNRRNAQSIPKERIMAELPTVDPVRSQDEPADSQPPVTTQPPLATPSGARASMAVGTLKLPGYVIQEEIAHGGMGAVLRVRDIRLNRELAV